MRAPRGIKHASGFPRHAAIARDRPSRYGEKTPSVHGGPRHRSRARPCKSRSPDLDPFGIGRSRTTEVMLVPRHVAIARDRPSRDGKKRHPFTEGPAIARAPGPVSQDRLILTRSGSGDPELQWWARCAPPKGDKACERVPSPCYDREGQALARREKCDREGQALALRELTKGLRYARKQTQSNASRDPRNR